MAKGKHSIGYCDRTGFEYPLNELVPQYENGFPNGLLVGRDMVDQDHPQLQLGKVNSADDQSLKNPRPDKERAESRSMWSWAPVGGGITELGSYTVGLDMSCIAGQVSIA